MVHEIAPAHLRALNRLIPANGLVFGRIGHTAGLDLYWTAACIALDQEIVEVQGKRVSDHCRDAEASEADVSRLRTERTNYASQFAAN